MIEQLIECRLSGQIDYAQWEEHCASTPGLAEAYTAHKAARGIPLTRAERGVVLPEVSVRAEPAGTSGQEQAGAVAWAAVHFGGKRDGKIYSTCDTREQVDAYIQQVHQSNDSVTLTARPVAFADAAPGAAIAAREQEAMALPTTVEGKYAL